MTEGQVREWRVHVGVHKTASTHMQNALNKPLRPHLEAAGVGVAVHRTAREVLSRELRMSRPLRWLRPARLARVVEERIGLRTPLLPRMVLSEENMLGGTPEALRRQPYRYSLWQLRMLAAGLTGASLWLSVRRFDQFLPAAYATAVKHTPPRLDPEALRRRTLAAPPDWTVFVGRLRRLLPDRVPITVWDYADYRANSQEIVEMLTGTSLPPLSEIPDPPGTRTPDADAVRAAAALPPDPANPDARSKRIDAIYKASTGPRFALFSEAEAERLGALHRRQVEAIGRIEGVRLLRF